MRTALSIIILAVLAASGSARVAHASANVWLASEVGQFGKQGKSCTLSNTCNAGLTCFQHPQFLRSRCEQALGAVSTTYGGTQQNRCVLHSIPSTLSSMSFDSWQTTSGSYDAREESPLPPDNSIFPDLNPVTKHVQGVARLPGSAGPRMMAFTVSNASVDTGIYFVALNQVNGNGGEEFSFGYANNRSLNRTVAFYRMPSHHPGGFQVIGDTAAIAGEHSQTGKPMVWMYNIANPVGIPASSALLQAIDLTAVDQRGIAAPVVPADKMSGVAITRLSSGRYVMAVIGDSYGSTRQLWIYASDETTLGAGTTWRLHNFQEYTLASGAENITFLTQCTGNIVLMHTGNSGSGDIYNLDQIEKRSDLNVVGAFNLVTNASGKIGVNPTASAVQTYWRNEGYCNFKSAGTFHVTPMGEMVLYCASRSANETNSYRFAEVPEPLYLWQ